MLTGQANRSSQNEQKNDTCKKNDAKFEFTEKHPFTRAAD